MHYLLMLDIRYLYRSKEGGPKETELEPLPHHQPEETKLKYIS